MVTVQTDKIMIEL